MILFIHVLELNFVPFKYMHKAIAGNNTTELCQWFPSERPEFFFDFVSKVRRSCVQFPAVCLIPAPLPLPYSRNNTPTAPFLQVLNSLCAAA
jgi:hypothetical protein